MTKNTKKNTSTQGKPITDFFTPASKSYPQRSKTLLSSSIPSQATSSGDNRPTGTLETTGALNNSIHVALIASKRSIESSSKVYGREFLDGSKSSHFTKRSLSKHPGASTPLKDRKAISDTIIKVSDCHRRKRDSDSDIDSEMANTVVYVNSTVCHSFNIVILLVLISFQRNSRSRKRARLSPPEDSFQVDFLVPRSQSDEEDFASMKEQAQLPTPTPENDEDMDVSSDNSLFSEPTTKATSTNCHSRTPNSTIHSTSQMPTPPLTVSAPAPILLDPAAKTAQIIAQIKERAYAKTHCSPEIAPLEFTDDLDDSDDDFLPVLPFATKPARYVNICYLSDKEMKYVFLLQLQRKHLGSCCVGRYIYQTCFSLFITKSFCDLVIVEFQSLLRTFKRITLKEMSYATKSHQGSHRKRE